MNGDEEETARNGTGPVAKGARVEREAVKILEHQGYVTHRTIRTAFRKNGHFISQPNDVFGCVDIIAKKAGERTRWVQVTSDKKIRAKAAAFEHVPWDHLFDSVEIWRWIPHKFGKIDQRTGKAKAGRYFQVYTNAHDFAFVSGARERAVESPRHASGTCAVEGS